MTTTLSGYRFISYRCLETPSANCEHCGNAIMQLYTLQDTTSGAIFVVGCDCVEHFLSPEIRKDTTDKIAKRAKRAARQWRENKPAHLEAETREQYIERRVREMGNALAAFKAWSSLFARNQTLYSMTVDSLAKDGISNPSDYGRYAGAHYTYPDSRDAVNPGHEGCSHDCWLCLQREALKKAYQMLVKEEQEAIIRRFEKKHQANRFDFSRAIWDVKKL